MMSDKQSIEITGNVENANISIGDNNWQQLSSYSLLQEVT